MAQHPELANQSQLAKILGVSRQRIIALERQGRVERRDDGLYPVASALEVMRTGLSQDHQQRRATMLERGGARAPTCRDGQYTVIKRHEGAFRAKMQELKFHREMGELISRAEVDNTLGVIIQMLQKRIRAIETRLFPYLNDEGRVVLKREVGEALRDTAKAFRDAAERGYLDDEDDA